MSKTEIFQQFSKNNILSNQICTIHSTTNVCFVCKSHVSYGTLLRCWRHVPVCVPSNKETRYLALLLRHSEKMAAAAAAAGCSTGAPLWERQGVCAAIVKIIWLIKISRTIWRREKPSGSSNKLQCKLICLLHAESWFISELLRRKPRKMPMDQAKNS